MHNKHLALLHRSLNKLITEKAEKVSHRKMEESGHKESVCHRGRRLMNGTLTYVHPVDAGRRRAFWRVAGQDHTLSHESLLTLDLLFHENWLS